MEPGGSKKDGGVVNMTMAMEALSPWLYHPRRTINQVEALVLVAAALLLLQLILGSCRRRWHNSFIKYGLQVCNGIMFPLTVYTLGTMQSSPIKNASYPVWAAFLIMASAGTTAIRQYDFYGSFHSKWFKVMGDYLRDVFYGSMFALLVVYNLVALDNKQHVNAKTASSYSVFFLAFIFIITKVFESTSLELFLDKERLNAFNTIKKIIRCIQAAGSMEETTANDGVSDSNPQSIEKTTANDGVRDSNPQSMEAYKYKVCYRLCGGGLITIDQIWRYNNYGNSADANALKDLCLSYALSWWLLKQRYFGLVVYPESSHLTGGHDFVFKQLLPSDSEADVKRAFRVIEVELGFCYDFFFTKYYHTFFWTNLLPVPFIHCLILLKIILIVTVGVFAIRRSVVLATLNPIIEVHLSEVDYIITLAVVGAALIVELAQAAFYLASNWAQVSLACMHVKKCCCDPSAYILGKFIGLLRWVMISQKLRNKIDQRSIIFRHKHQPNPVKVSNAMKKAIARSLRSTYASNLTTSENKSVRLHNQIFAEYSWALKDLSRLEVMLIWHIATEYCHISDDPSNNISDDPSNRTGTTQRGTHLFGYVLHLLRPHRRTAPDGPRGVAVHLSRYCAYLISCVPEVLPYHEANIAELKPEVVDDLNKFFSSFHKRSETYSKMKNLEGTREKDDPSKMFQKGVKLGKQLVERKPDGEHWKVLQDFWAEMIIHFAAAHYTTKQHMQHLENGGEFLTHVWALLAHAGILDQESYSVKKDPKSQTDLESGHSVVA